MEQLKISSLIAEISPLYNRYKQSAKEMSGADSICIMWDIGDYLKKAIEENQLSPHNLYRKIYGKSEGSTDITQKSYISRELLGRAYRIRNIFKNKTDIQEMFPHLKSFILFRESMPFFDNEKYKFSGTEKKALIDLLNSKENNSSILKKIRKLQSEKIGIKNSRNQKLGELSNEKEVFINFYNYLFNLIKSENYESLGFNKIIDSDKVLKLSSATNCLSQEGLKYPNLSELSFPDEWEEYVNLLIKFSSQTDPKERRRFRRLIPPSRIVRLAEILLSISSIEAFEKFKRK